MILHLWWVCKICDPSLVHCFGSHLDWPILTNRKQQCRMWAPHSRCWGCRCWSSLSCMVSIQVSDARSWGQEKAGRQTQRVSIEAWGKIARLCGKVDQPDLLDLAVQGLCGQRSEKDLARGHLPSARTASENPHGRHETHSKTMPHHRLIHSTPSLEHKYVFSVYTWPSRCQPNDVSAGETFCSEGTVPFESNPKVFVDPLVFHICSWHSFKRVYGASSSKNKSCSNIVLDIWFKFYEVFVRFLQIKQPKCDLFAEKADLGQMKLLKRLSCDSDCHSVDGISMADAGKSSSWTSSRHWGSSVDFVCYPTRAKSQSLRLPVEALPSSKWLKCQQRKCGVQRKLPSMRIDPWSSLWRSDILWITSHQKKT